MRAGFAFLTVLGGARSPSPSSLVWFPAVGMVVGGALGGLWWGVSELWPPGVAAVIVVIAGGAITGFLHIDGLADAADGLLVHGADPPRRLAIMDAPDVGAYGAATVSLVLMAQVMALAAQAPTPLLLAGLWTASRMLMALIPALVPYARDEGLASAFVARAPSRWPAIALVPAAGLCALALGWAGVAALGALIVAVGATVGLARRRLGGFTGDVLGAAAVLGETAGLVVASARW